MKRDVYSSHTFWTKRIGLQLTNKNFVASKFEIFEFCSIKTRKLSIYYRDCGKKMTIVMQKGHPVGDFFLKKSIENPKILQRLVVH